MQDRFSMVPPCNAYLYYKSRLSKVMMGCRKERVIIFDTTKVPWCWPPLVDTHCHSTKIPLLSKGPLWAQESGCHPDWCWRVCSLQCFHRKPRWENGKLQLVQARIVRLWNNLVNHFWFPFAKVSPTVWDTEIREQKHRFGHSQQFGITTPDLLTRLPARNVP